MLAKIKEAEEAYRLEYETYIDCANTATCNTSLGLILPPTNWAYSVTGSSATAFTAQASGTLGTQSPWTIDESTREAF